jgi:zinc transport system ATP-binding protein
MTISLQNISFSYDKTPVLEDINLSIEAGEFIGVFGPNGGGKTTLLKLLMGFIEPTTGEIQLMGTSPKEVRRSIGYVPQINKMDKQFPITTEEVVQMGCLSKITLLGKLPLIYKKKALEALEKVHMSHKASIPFGHLSGGEAQRVLIARALVSDPLFLFLDEPTASVDPKAEEDILSILSSLKGSLTLVMVTHDLQAILQKVGKLICVHRRAHTLAPSEVCEHYGLGLYHSPLIQILGQ